MDSKTRPIGLSKLKMILGKRGLAFARLVGIPADTLKSIESGRRRLSPENATKIWQATGVLKDSLYAKSPASGRKANGEAIPYEASYLEKWGKIALELGDEKEEARSEAGMLAESIGNWTKVLLLASIEENKGTTFKNIHKDIAKQLSDLATRCYLRGSIKRVLKDYPLVSRRELTGAEWRRKWRKSKYSRHLCRAYGLDEKRLKKMEDYKKYPLSMTMERSFLPHVRFLIPQAKEKSANNTRPERA
jgi:hypothetical protein